MNKLKTFAENRRDTGLLLIILAVLTVFVGGKSPEIFFSVANAKNIALQLVEYGCFATAFFLTSVCGGMNFACVTTGNLAAIVMATVYTALSPGMPVAMALLISLLTALLVGGMCGTLIALLVSRCRLTQLLSTICATRLFEGIAHLVTKSSSVMGPKPLLKFGSTYIAGVIPVLLLLTIACFLFCSVFLNKTTFGQQSKLFGLNKVANTYSGINNEVTLIVVYSISGMLSAVGGICILCMFGSTKPDFGTSLTAMIMLIVLLSGIATSVGQSKVSNVLIACLCVQVINTGLTLAGSTDYVAEFMCGAMLLVVILLSNQSFRHLFSAKFKMYLHAR